MGWGVGVCVRHFRSNIEVSVLILTMAKLVAFLGSTTRDRYFCNCSGTAISARLLDPLWGAPSRRRAYYMKLKTFQITNFRSINDSGSVTVENMTSLVGRNESGKSNLLLALRTLNPPGGMTDLNRIKDFPRHRRLSECTDDTPVVRTTWELDPAEQEELASVFPRANGITHVTIGRNYKAPTRWVGFVDLKPIVFAPTEVAARIREIRPFIEAAADILEDAPKQLVKAATAKFAAELISSRRPAEWAATATTSLANIRNTLASNALILADREAGLLSELEGLAASIAGDEHAYQAARSWIASRFPVFV